MKKIIILIVLIPFTIFSQSWKFESGGNSFDGKYKTSYIQGVGDHFPYTKPLMAINKFENKDDINFYISDAGYFQEGTNVSIKWVFSNEPNVIYSTYDFSYSNDGKILFFKEFNNPNSNGKLSDFEIIEKLKSANKVSIRISDNYGSNDLTFSLNGSTKAIEFVVPKEEFDSKIESIRKERAEQMEIEMFRTAKIDKLINIAKDHKMEDSYLSSLKYQIEMMYKIGYEYETIKILPSDSNGMFESYGYVDIYGVSSDGSDQKIMGTYKVSMDSPLFEKILEEKIQEEVKKELEEESVKNLLSKYKIEKLKDFILKEIIDKHKYYHKNEWSLNQIENISTIFSEYQYGKFWKLKIIIHLNTEEKITLDSHIYSLEITKKELKEIGGEMNEEF